MDGCEVQVNKTIVARMGLVQYVALKFRLILFDKLFQLKYLFQIYGS